MDARLYWGSDSSSRPAPRTASSCTALSFDHDHQFPTTEGARELRLLVERSHRCHGSRREDLEHHTSKGRLRHRRRPSRNNQGILLPSAMRCSELTRSQESMINAMDYVELGLFCSDICRALDRGMNEKKLNDLSQSMCDAINQLTM